MRKVAITVVALVVFVVGCRGKMLATAELHGAGTADAHFTATGAPVFLWADTDGKWRGGGSQNSRFPARYEIDVLSKGVKIGHVSCDTESSSSKVCGKSVSIGQDHSGDCELKLACAVPAIPAGDAELHVTGTPGSGVVETRKMSINVRDK